MEKTIIECRGCKKRMKISYKLNKYKCPHCGEVYKLTRIKFILLKLKGVFLGIKETVIDIKNNVVYKVKSIKSTYKYVSSMKKNMKGNPEWSNYYKEKKESDNLKKANRNWKIKDWFKKR
jgi:hypothetical protein